MTTGQASQQGELRPAAGAFAPCRSTDALASALEHQQAGRLQEAERIYRQVLSAEPSHPQALHLLGLLNYEAGKSAIAVAFISRAIAIEPRIPSFHHNLGAALQAQGRLDEALASYRQALAIRPDSPQAHSNLLTTLQFVPGPRAALVAEARAWGARHAEPLTAGVRPHRNRADPERRLRIGYVSGELYRHPVGYFLESVLIAHERSRVEVFCYTNGQRTDDLTARLRGASDHWRSLVGIGDVAAAELIRADGIDILVDLSGHVGNHRLLVFARRAAPVQATWLGYSDTLGISTVDYIMADPIVCPEGDDEFYVERVVRLPSCFLCYRPPRPSPDVAELPALSRGYITLGCFNRISKITPEVAALWAEVLRKMPEARLCLKGSGLDEPMLRARYSHMFRDQGVVPNRLRLLGPSPHRQHLAAHSEIDLALDPFPYSGSTSTAEALWMGVPVVSLRGDRFVSRTSATILAAVGLPDLVAESPQGYVETVVALADDVRQLAQLRATLRQRVARSPLCDGPRFTSGLESAYREMWRAWCQAQRASK
jgi:protein O-GlcNAc transferase